MVGLGIVGGGGRVFLGLVGGGLEVPRGAVVEGWVCCEGERC